VPTQPVNVAAYEGEEVLCEAFTDLHYQEMLRQASILYPFDPNTIVGTLSIPEALPASHPEWAQTPAESSSMVNGAERMTDVDDVNVDVVQVQTAVALAFQGEQNVSLLAVTLMNLSPQPTAKEVLLLMTNSTEANTCLLCRELGVLRGEEVSVGTAKKPVFIRDLHVHCGDPNICYKVLGTLEEARNDADKYLMQCMDCLEADSYRQFAEPPIPLSIPLLILYFEHLVSLLS
jgi:hypothetical protein